LKKKGVLWLERPIRGKKKIKSIIICKSFVWGAVDTQRTWFFLKIGPEWAGREGWKRPWQLSTQGTEPANKQNRKIPVRNQQLKISDRGPKEID